MQTPRPLLGSAPTAPTQRSAEKRPAPAPLQPCVCDGQGTWDPPQLSDPPCQGRRGRRVSATKSRVAAVWRPCGGEEPAAVCALGPVTRACRRVDATARGLGTAARQAPQGRPPAMGAAALTRTAQSERRAELDAGRVDAVLEAGDRLLRAPRGPSRVDPAAFPAFRPETRRLSRQLTAEPAEMVWTAASAAVAPRPGRGPCRLPASGRRPRTPGISCRRGGPRGRRRDCVRGKTAGPSGCGGGDDSAGKAATTRGRRSRCGTSPCAWTEAAGNRR